DAPLNREIRSVLGLAKAYFVERVHGEAGIGDRLDVGTPDHRDRRALRLTVQHDHRWSAAALDVIRLDAADVDVLSAERLEHEHPLVLSHRALQGANRPPRAVRGDSLMRCA